MSSAPAGREIAEVFELSDASRPHHEITASSTQEEETAEHQRAVQREIRDKLFIEADVFVMSFMLKYFISPFHVLLVIKSYFHYISVK